MVQDYSNKCCAVHDNGLFVEIAVTLSKYFGKTYYYSPWESQFPRSNQNLIGKGVEGITRVDDFSSIIEEVDLFCFPDVYFGGLQLQLEAMGKRVWGSRKGEELELCRRESKEYMKRLGIPIGNYKVVVGLPALRAYLRNHGNQWVKISCTRGDMESFHSPSYDLVEPKLDELEHVLGAKSKIMEFIVEDSIDDAVEISYDGYCVDGVFPDLAMVGLEIKDKGYLGVIEEKNELLKEISSVNEKLAPTLQAYGYKNFISPEMRITREEIGYVIDPCCRAGSPPNEVQQVMFTNLPDIFWYGAEGTCIEPIPAGKHAAELLIHSAWADKNWQAISFPEEIRDNIKLRNLTVIDGKYYVVPQSVGLPEIGAVVAVGDSREEAVEKVKDYARQIEGYFIDIFPETLDQAEEEIAKLNSMGIEF